MSESSEEEVLEVSKKFKHLFQGSCFKFEGLSAETEVDFVKLVKKMGAEVSNNARFTFVQRSYFEKKSNSMRDNLYNIDYIADSVKEGAALDLNDYMFIPDHAARYMYKTDSCQECYYSKVFCKECASIQESSRAANQDRNHIVSATDSSFESEDEIMNSPDQEAVEHSSKSSKRMIPSDLEQDSNDEEQIKSSCAEKSPVRKKMKNSKTIDNTCYRKESPEIDIENYSESSHSQSNDNFVNNSQNEQVEEATNGISGTAYNVIEPRILGPRKSGMADAKEDDLSGNLSDSESNAKGYNNKNSSQKAKTVSISGWLNSSKSKMPVKTKPPALSEPERLLNIADNDDDEEERYFKGEKWWLQQCVPENEKCTKVSCSFEPKDHPSHYPSCKFLSLIEKKILVKYLIIRNLIDKAKGKNVYQDMIKHGYLKHRSWETLNNCFRRTIINEIESYTLDQGLLNEFLKHRLKNITKVKKHKNNVSYLAQRKLISNFLT